jgi:hypothetical protein
MTDSEYHKKWREENKERVREYGRLYYLKNKEEIISRSNKWKEENREQHLANKKKYTAKTVEKRKEYRKEYNQRPEAITVRKKWQDGYRKTRNENRNKRYKEDAAYKLQRNISKTILDVLKKQGTSKFGNSVLNYLPYTMKELREHIENQWVEGMSWENHSNTGWHIDHIMPQSKLIYDSMEHPNFLKCWSLNNLQPMWADENIRKSNK